MCWVREDTEYHKLSEEDLERIRVNNRKWRICNYSGPESPYKPTTMVDVLLRNNKVLFNQKCSSLRWRHTHPWLVAYNEDIVAYKLSALPRNKKASYSL